MTQDLLQETFENVSAALAALKFSADSLAQKLGQTVNDGDRTNLERMYLHRAHHHLAICVAIRQAIAQPALPWTGTMPFKAF